MRACASTSSSRSAWRTPISSDPNGSRPTSAPVTDWAQRAQGNRPRLGQPSGLLDLLQSARQWPGTSRRCSGQGSAAGETFLKPATVTIMFEAHHQTDPRLPGMGSGSSGRASTDIPWWSTRGCSRGSTRRSPWLPLTGSGWSP
jgi:hypothetical protein